MAKESLHERNFRRFEDVIAKIVNEWPGPTSLVIRPNENIEGLATRLRDAIRYSKTNPIITDKFDRIKLYDLPIMVRIRNDDIIIGSEDSTKEEVDRREALSIAKTQLESQFLEIRGPHNLEQCIAWVTLCGYDKFKPRVLTLLGASEKIVREAIDTVGSEVHMKIDVTTDRIMLL